MDSERYLVELEFKRVGDFGVEKMQGSLKRAERGVDAFKRGWSDVRSSIAPVGDAIDGVVRSAMGLAKTGVMVGGAALFAGATYGVANLNNELEKAEISLGTIFSANGIAANVPTGISVAKDTIAKMRIDAQKLPGEFEDLMTIFTTGAIPAFRSSASVDRFRGVAAQAMAAGKVAQMDTGQVAREFAQLLEGRAGSHNVFGMKLMGLSGDSAAKFNAMSADKRLAMIQTELQKYSGAIDAFGESFDAQSSTLLDNFKSFGRSATAPLFKSVKDTMGEANAWFLAHQAQVDRFAGRVGTQLAAAFESGKHFIQEWWPAIENFGEKAYDRIAGVWKDAKPYVEQFGTALANALKDPNGTIDKMIELAKLLIALKVGKEALGIAGAAAGAAGGVAQMLGAAKQMGWLGGGAAAINGASKIGLLGRAGSALGAGVGAVGPYALAAAPPAAIAGALWYGAFGGVKTQGDHDADARLDGAQRADQMFKKLDDQGMHYNDMMQTMRDEAGFMRAQFQSVTAAAFELEFALKAASKLDVMKPGELDADNTRERNKALIAGPLKPAAEGPNKNAHKAKGGGGGIQKVEIVVTSNQHPSRIARAVVGEIGKLARNRRSSPDVRNYSKLEEI